MIWGKNSYQDVEAFISVCFLSITQISFHYKLFALLKSLLLEHIMLTWLDLGCVWWILLLSLRNLWFCMYVQYCSVFEDKLKRYYLYNTVILYVWFDPCSSSLCPSCTACSSTWVSPLSMVSRWVHAAQRVSCYCSAERDPNLPDYLISAGGLGTRPIPEHDLSFRKVRINQA